MRYLPASFFFGCLGIDHHQGIPFDTDDAMFQPPNVGLGPGYDVPIVSYQELDSSLPDSVPIAPISVGSFFCLH